MYRLSNNISYKVQRDNILTIYIGCFAGFSKTSYNLEVIGGVGFSDIYILEVVNDVNCHLRVDQFEQ